MTEGRGPHHRVLLVAVAQAFRLGAVLKEAGVPVRVFGAKDTEHTKLNDDLGSPNDPATKALYEFVADTVKK